MLLTSGSYYLQLRKNIMDGTSRSVISTRLSTILLMALLFAVTISCDKTRGDLQLVSAEPQKGFNFPYFIFIPEEGLSKSQISFIVEPNNTGNTSDDFDYHLEAARQQARSSQIGNYLSHELKYPLLVPVFPRPEANWKIYTHALDRDALVQKESPLERLDLQLIAMFDDAKMKLRQRGYQVDDKFLMAGFSACASFTNRFAAIHPQKVKAYVAGGLNGMPIVPMKEINGQPLLYPLGVGDLFELTGKPFDSLSFINIPQFLFMGENDDNDAAPYDDAYDDSEREVIYKVLGKKMLPDRWNLCTGYYKTQHVNVSLKLYENTGHEITKKIQGDILEFVKKVPTK